MKTLSCIAPITLLAATLLPLAAAAQSAPYVELAAGLSHAKIDCTGTTACDNRSAFVRATAGYTIAPMLGVELSLVDHGKFTASAFVPGIGQVDATAKLQGVGLGLATRLPLGAQLAFGARLGLASNRTSVSGSAAGQSTSEAQRNTAPYAGIGLHYTPAPALSLGLLLDATRAEFDGEKSTVAGFGASLRYSF